MKSDIRNSQRYAWLIGSIADTNPQILLPHFEELLDKLDKPCHAAVKRNVFRAMSKNAIPSKHAGRMADLCFTCLDDIKEPIAVRVFSMIILYEICLLEPDLSLELIPVLEYHIPHSKPGFQSKAKKIIHSLSKSFL